MKLSTRIALCVGTSLWSVGAFNIFAQEEAEAPVPAPAEDTAVVVSLEQPPPYREVSKLLSLYLDQNSRAVKSQIKSIQTLMRPTQASLEPTRQLLKHIEEKKLTPEELFMATESDAGICAYSFLMLFFQLAEERRIVRPAEAIGYLDNYVQNAKISEDVWVQSFIARVPEWKEWVQSGCTRRPKLEKLLTNSSVFEKISDLGKDAFEAHYKKITNRPSVEGLIFDQDEVVAYLKGIKDPATQRGENARFARFKSLKPYLISLFARNTYTGTLLLKRGSRSGTINLVNEHELIMKASSRRGKGKSYKWGDFNLKMFAKFLDYFANRRLTTQTREGKAKQELDAGDDYIGMAIIYLFANDYDNAYDAAVKAEKLNPKTAEIVKKVFGDAIPHNANESP